MPTSKLFSYGKYLLAVLLYITPAKAQTGIDTALSKALQNSINNMRTTYNVKGISAAAFIPGKGLWKGVTGESHANTPIDTSMLLCIGSITKTFIAAEIMKLVDGGQLSLSDNVGTLLPPIQNVNAAITVRQLLNHTSGMGDYNQPCLPTRMQCGISQMLYIHFAMPLLALRAAHGNTQIPTTAFWQ